MSVDDDFRKRFAVFANEPWWDNTVLQYGLAWENDGQLELGVPASMERQLLDLAKARGITIAPVLCDDCETTTLEVRGTCAACIAEDAAYDARRKIEEAAEKARRAALTPEQRAAEDALVPRMYAAGIFKRDVQ